MVPFWEFWNPASGFFGGLLVGPFVIVVIIVTICVIHVLSKLCRGKNKKMVS